MLRSAEAYLRLPRRRYFSVLELHAASIGTVATAVLLIGYGFNFAPFQTVFPGFPTMQPVTATVLMALAIRCKTFKEAQANATVLVLVVSLRRSSASSTRAAKRPGTCGCRRSARSR